MGNRLKKSLLSTPIYNSNYDLNDNTSNDFRSVENRNEIATSNGSSFIDANGAAALDTTNNDCNDDDDDGEKSISIKNRLGDSPTKSWCLNTNKRQTNIMDDTARADCLDDDGQQWRQQWQKQQHQSQHNPYTYESVQPMKTQCETYCKCCTSSNFDSLIMQHSIASFKLCRTHGKQLYIVCFFFFLFFLSYFYFEFIFLRCYFCCCSFCSLNFCAHFGTQCFYVISVLQSHHNQLKTPRVGEPTTIISTHVLNATQFYGQLGRHFTGFHYFQQRLNIRRSHFEYEQYSQMPGTIVISYFCCFSFVRYICFAY